MGIPLRDISRRPVHPPVVTVSIIIINALVFFLELTGGDAFVQRWSVIPADIVAGQNWVTILTSMFMHGGWMHIIGNMLFLWCFGRSLEDAMGAGKFMIFYLLCGVAAAFTQSFLTWGSRAPMVGASGAIAGVMGAYLLKFPRARIQTLVVVIVFITRVEIPAVLILGYWFLVQLFSGAGAIGYSTSEDDETPS